MLGHWPECSTDARTTFAPLYIIQHHQADPFNLNPFQFEFFSIRVLCNSRPLNTISMRSSILGNVLLAGSIFGLAFSAPTASPTTHRLTRRANPSLDSSFGASDTETQQINDAFFDAIELASTAVVEDIDTNGPIFAKYFNDADKATVRSVFMNIMGNPADPMNPDTTGNDLLGKITVTRSDPDGDCAADATLMAQLARYATDTPLLEVCPVAGFGHGGIGKDPNKVICENLGDTVSWRMETLGSILLHGYTYVCHGPLNFEQGILTILLDTTRTLSCRRFPHRLMTSTMVTDPSIHERSTNL